MTSKHEEFPELTHQAKCVLGQSINVSMPYWNRRFAADVIREAMVQSGTWNINSDFPRVIDAKNLDAIADNLYALPPEPPLKKQALDIWDQVEGEVSDAQARIMRTALALIPEPTPFLKDYGGQVIGYGEYAGTAGDGTGVFLDPSLGQPWPEDQVSDRPAARPRQITYQHVVGQCIAGGGGVNSEPIAYQIIAGENGGLGIQDLPIRDWANLAAIVDRAERVLLNSITNRSIDVGCVLQSLIGEIRDELGLPKPSEAAK
jgi:hypothetical protein